MSKSVNRVKVTDVIDFVVKEFELDKDDFYKKLDSKELLPISLKVKDVPTKVKSNGGPKFASKVAELLATENCITPVGVPSSKRGWTKADIQKLIDGDKLTLPSITRAAKEFAEIHEIDWTKIVGTSKKGQITKNDISKIVKSKKSESESEKESESESEKESESESESESE
jgi:pyruvate/2-oxoglutarate dehydrogenase complex dihydrolipoamide acyltransferase (E2) component